MLYLSYLVSGKPKYGMLKMEAFNEFCTLSLSYMMLLYTDFLEEYSLRNHISFAFLGVFGLNLVVNFLVIMKATISETI